MPNSRELSELDRQVPADAVPTWRNPANSRYRPLRMEPSDDSPQGIDTCNCVLPISGCVRARSIGSMRSRRRIARPVCPVAPRHVGAAEMKAGPDPRVDDLRDPLAEA